jgi:hypothetical protein
MIYYDLSCLNKDALLRGEETLHELSVNSREAESKTLAARSSFRMREMKL